MRVEIVHSTRGFRTSRRALRTLAERFALRLAARTPRRRWEDISLILLDDAGIAAANRACFRRDRPTDVISLTYRPAGRGGGWRGDILVNVERARQQGRRYGGAARELALYIAHGFDHLSGADDDTPRRRAAMRRRENRWLRETLAHWKDLPV